MKYLGTNNLTRINPKQIYCLLGYEIFVPDSYFNPLAFLNCGCPIWIKYNDKGECKIYEITDKDNWIEETVLVIKQNLPRKRGWYCTSLKQDIKVKHSIHTDDYYGLSAVCYNENDEVKAIISLDRDDVLSSREGTPCASIAKIVCYDEEALSFVWDYITRDYNIKRHRGLLISYIQDSRKYGELLEMIKWEDGLFYYQFE